MATHTTSIEVAHFSVTEPIPGTSAPCGFVWPEDNTRDEDRPRCSDCRRAMTFGTHQWVIRDAIGTVIAVFGHGQGSEASDYCDANPAAMRMERQDT